ncbi:AEC family transporter [Svornostia abyssi]|uniref:AEC family transporter n=1 Tax=Svornostia abyssi TaxID=2898438 RepID=A0ABY5PIP7_9ACTN|nr:AEC family transporter [Parviterribacteraceae bacterium J379]
MGAGIVFGYLVIAAVGVLAWLIGSRILQLPRSSTGALIVTSILANTGYLGIPLILVLLGGDQVGYAIVWDSLISYPMAFIVAFAIGAAFGDHGASDVRARILSFFTKNPIPWAFAIGLVLPDAAVPDWLFDAMKLLASSLLPLGFFMVGVQLSAEGEHGTFRFPRRSPHPSRRSSGCDCSWRRCSSWGSRRRRCPSPTPTTCRRPCRAASMRSSSPTSTSSTCD